MTLNCAANSTQRWSYDSNGGTPDLPLEHFNLTEPGEKMVGWLAKMYARAGDISVSFCKLEDALYRCTHFMLRCAILMTSPTTKVQDQSKYSAAWIAMVAAAVDEGGE